MVLDRFAMPIWSCIQSRGSFVAIVSSMTYEYRLAVGVKDGVYSCYACFDLNGHMPYEPITIEFRLLDDKADYNEAALAYREWREQRGELRRYDVCLLYTSSIPPWSPHWRAMVWSSASRSRRCPGSGSPRPRP